MRSINDKLNLQNDLTDKQYGSQAQDGELSRPEPTDTNVILPRVPPE
jgi:hypothetical protein